MPEPPPFELRRLLLNVLLAGTPAPDPLFVGLFTDLPSAISHATIAAREIVGDSHYRRQPVKQKDWLIDQSKLIAKAPVYFVNVGDKRWRSVRGIFLSTAAEGPGALITYMMMQQERILLPGDSLRLDMEIEL